MAIKIKKKRKDKEPKVKESELEDDETAEDEDEDEDYDADVDEDEDDEDDDDDDDDDLAPSVEMDDKFVNTSLGAAKWIDQNRQKLVIGFIVLVVAITGFVAWQSYEDSQRLEEASALNIAIEAYAYPTVEEADSEKQYIEMINEVQRSTYPVPNYRKTHADSQARHNEAYTLASEAAANYPEAEIAGEAHLLAASAAFYLNKKDETAQHLGQALTMLPKEEPTSLFASLMDITLLMEEGKYEEAIAGYDSLMSSTAPQYGSFLLLEKGMAQELAGKNDAAIQTYVALINGYTTAPAYQLSEARRRLNLLSDDPEALLFGTGSSSEEASTEDAPAEDGE